MASDTTTGELRPGDVIVHRFNSDLGPGRVEQTQGRRVVVFFPKTQARLTFAAADTALAPLQIGPRARVRVEASGEETLVAERLDPAAPGEGVRYRLADGRVLGAAQVWPLEAPSDPVERSKALGADPPGHFANRLDGLRLLRARQARWLGSFLGGRIALFPHQLHVAERATAADPVRWLLADEVGLGKTIEACLILSRLLRTGRADRTVVVAPATLTVQWLGELYRKFHQTFVLLDEKRRADVEREMGRGFNPFDAHRRVVVPLEDLLHDARLAAAAARAGTDLLVVDEAHRLQRQRGGPGNAAYRAVAPLTRTAEHVLLLSATPLEADTHGFFRLLELLRPDAYTSEEDFLAALEAGRPLPPCTSATRRVDIGGIPPRVPLPVELEWAADAPSATPARGAASTLAGDERVHWLARAARGWVPGGGDEGKALVFCHDVGTLTALKTRLEGATGRRVAIFHEELPPERCDLEVADFRRPEGPALMISTECGGEGRNFEFCRRLVLFDLPRDPAQVEQRIGRLDRVTRRRPIEIVYFRPRDGFEAELVRLYEDIGLFRQPLGGLERSLRHVELEIRKTELGWRAGRRLAREKLAGEVRAAVQARERAVYHHLHVDGYRGELAAGLLARVPPALDADVERFTLGACELFGFDALDKPGARTWYVEFGAGALVDHLAGVPGGSRWLGTFDRAEAVAREELDFFASGHPLVEALFHELEDGPRGRVALVEVAGARTRGLGLLAVCSLAAVNEPRPAATHGADPGGSASRLRGATPAAPERPRGRTLPPGAVPLVGHEPEGPLFALAVDLSGRLRPEWARVLLTRGRAFRPLSREDWLDALTDVLDGPHGWPDHCAALLDHATAGFTVEAVAAFRMRA